MGVYVAKRQADATAHCTSAVGRFYLMQQLYAYAAVIHWHSSTPGANAAWSMLILQVMDMLHGCSNELRQVQQEFKESRASTR
jgi:hypothetical protein